MEPQVLYTDNGDGSADFTLSVYDEDYRFSANREEEDRAIVEYEETLSWRGEFRVSEPDEEIFKMLMTSDEMTEFLDSNGYAGVIRDR